MGINLQFGDALGKWLLTGVKVHDVVKVHDAHILNIPDQCLPLSERFSIRNFHMDEVCAIELDHSTANQVACSHYNMGNAAILAPQLHGKRGWYNPCLEGD
jgi:hypothetical protein